RAGLAARYAGERVPGTRDQHQPGNSRVPVFVPPPQKHGGQTAPLHRHRRRLLAVGVHPPTGARGVGIRGNGGRRRTRNQGSLGARGRPARLRDSLRDRGARHGRVPGGQLRPVAWGGRHDGAVRYGGTAFAAAAAGCATRGFFGGSGAARGRLAPLAAASAAGCGGVGETVRAELRR
ncbi:unnamed protein product, partial [Ectocarpus sp. 8 AP-2014]